MGIDHHDEYQSGKNLKIAFILNLSFTVFELIGGYFVNSVAIISDAIHDLGDSISLGTALYLEKKSKDKADNEFSFGYARFSLLGALITALMLIAGSIYVIYEAVGRLIEPEPSDAQGMLLFAIVGVAVNGFAAWKLSKGKSINEKMISWHLLEDVLGWVAILIVAIVLNFYRIDYLDPALSLLITAYILYNVVKRLKKTLYVFLQGKPEEIDMVEIKKKLVTIDHVQSLHHTHIWSLEGESHVFSTHVKLKNINSLQDLLQVKNEIKDALDPYHFKHMTIETELDQETCALDN